MTNKLISFVLPTFNESGNIVPLVEEINKSIKDKKEIIVVDDDSPDGTSQKVRDYIVEHKKTNILLLTRKHNHGLTNSIRDGIKKAKGEVIVWMDCDFSHPPKVVPLLLKQIDKGYDIAVASRFAKGGGFVVPEKDSSDSWVAIILSRMMNYSIQTLLGNNFGDYTSGFVAVKKRVFQKIHLRGDYGEYFIGFIFRAFAFGFKIVEIPYIQLPRASGESKTGTNLVQYLRRGIRYMFTTFRLLWERHIMHAI